MVYQIDYQVIVLAVAQIVGIIVFLRFYINGLKRNIEVLQETAENHRNAFDKQKMKLDTIDKMLQTMETRYLEIKRIGEFHNRLINELPLTIEKYRKITQKLKEESKADFEKAQALLDEETKKFKKKEIESIEAKEKMIDELPELMLQFYKIMNLINERLKLFTEKGKYPTSNILSYEALQGKSVLAVIGRQHDGLLYRDLLKLPAEEELPNVMDGEEQQPVAETGTNKNNKK